MTNWILIVEANLDVGVEANTEEEATDKAEELLEKIMISDMIIDDGTHVSVDLQLQHVIKA